MSDAFAAFHTAMGNAKGHDEELRVIREAAQRLAGDDNALAELRDAAVYEYGVFPPDAADQIARGIEIGRKKGKPKSNGATGNNLPVATWRDHVFTSAKLMQTWFAPIKYVVPDLIPEGLTILAGRPKVCKSWMALDIALSIAASRFCLGDKKPTQGDVLYAAMEDNQRRLKWRIGKILGDEPAPERLTLATSWRRLDKGGVADIAEWLDAHPEARLVILDTLAGVKPIRTQQGYTEDYASLEQLHRLANDRGVAIVVIHHVRKMEAEDPIDTISGTLGLAGCADTLMVISRTSQGTTLYLRGRDVQEMEHAVSFDKHSCRWTILGEAAEVHRSAERGKILAALDKKAPDPMTPQEIAFAAGMARNSVDQLLFKMVADGEVEKEGRGKYRKPT